MDVTIQDSHRAKALQVSKSALAIACSPSPIADKPPQRDVREHDYGSIRAKAFDIVFEPFQLIVAELTQAPGLKV